MSESNLNNLPVYNVQGDSEEEQSLQLADLWALVWDHKWWYVICILVALMAASFYLYKTPKTYSRTEKVIVDEDSQNSMMRDLTSFAGTARRYTSGTNVDNEIEAFAAPDLMQRVVTRLGLETAYIDNQFLRVRELYKNSPIEMRAPENVAASSFSFSISKGKDSTYVIRDFFVGAEEFKGYKLNGHLSDTVETPVGKIVIYPTTRQIPGLIYSSTSIDRLMEMEDAPKEVAGDPVRLTGPAGIRVENLDYRYPDGKRMILKDLTFDFPPLSRTAIVGETGAGKSTLIRLMLALLKPVGGRVVLYDEAQETPASAATRCNLVYVPQGNTLFSGSVRENLLMGKPDATEDEMKAALETAVADFVYSLPDGLETRCGEGGSGLSEGQSQRIAIARGLLRPGSILLLDEFSSSLDPNAKIINLS